MRRTASVTIVSEGRDKGKTFFLTEMPAYDAEMWAIRAFLALAKSGADIPDDIREAGMAGLAVVGIKALSGVPFEEAKILMDAMFDCVEVIRDQAHPEMKFALLPNDIEEVLTRGFLRDKIFELHTGFSFVAAKLNSISPAAATEAATPQAAST